MPFNVHGPAGRILRSRNPAGDNGNDDSVGRTAGTISGCLTYDAEILSFLNGDTATLISGRFERTHEQLNQEEIH
jgi:hypothetical protein